MNNTDKAEIISRDEAIEKINSDLINTSEYDRDFVISIIINGWKSLDEMSNDEIEEIYYQQFDEYIKITMNEVSNG